MGNREGFSGGFFAGAIVGGIVGGVLGSLLTSRKNNELEEEDQSLLKANQQPKFTTEESMEDARLSLEEKISQLNLAIDDVRQQLGQVNGISPDKD